jgi:uncharacterized protein (DUF2147 family)
MLLPYCNFGDINERFAHKGRLGLCALLGLIAVLSLGAHPTTVSERSPAGLWKTIDDRTHKPRATIRIFEENGGLTGRIESSFNPAEWHERCDKCSGDRKDAPVIGLVIMRGLTRHGAEYDGGEILDPETGFVYRCRLALSGDGDKLFVRGYLGVSLLGRTQTWTRLEEAAAR